MDVLFFNTPADFRDWLAANHTTTAELWVGYFRKSTGRPSLTWPESVDQALCFGWIDGVRRRIDDESYANRFTPRRRGSNWSLVNIKRALELIEAELMQPAGLAAF
ncbi:MAG TPA: bacteriocin-protection protein, partial [Promineifilum sp.]|nr:bacteriocin-protection protein [Promineifilum sp.]